MPGFCSRGRRRGGACGHRLREHLGCLAPIWSHTVLPCRGGCSPRRRRPPTLETKASRSRRRLGIPPAAFLSDDTAPSPLSAICLALPCCLVPLCFTLGASSPYTSHGRGRESFGSRASLQVCFRCASHVQLVSLARLQSWHMMCLVVQLLRCARARLCHAGMNVRPTGGPAGLSDCVCVCVRESVLTRQTTTRLTCCSKRHTRQWGLSG